MRRRQLIVHAFALGALVATAGCRGACGGAGASPDAGAFASADASLVPDGGSATTRCHLRSTRAPLGTDVVVGEALVVDRQVYVGVLRHGSGGFVASLAAVPIDLSGPARFIDLGVARGDDPPPRPLLLGGVMHVARYEDARPDAGAKRGTARALLVDRLAGDHVEAHYRVPQPDDESLAFDVATSGQSALLAWDDDEGIDTLALGADAVRGDGGLQPASWSGESDAETFAPRVIARQGGGYWLLWIARHAEPEEDGAPPPIEGAGEARAFSWVEALPLDVHGAKAGELLRLTSTHGHVDGFDLASASNAGAASLLVDRNEEDREGEGGRLVAFALGHDKADGAGRTLLSGSGSGAPEIFPFAEGRAFVAYVDAAERAHLALAGTDLGAGRGDARPSAEPTLDGGRPLTVLSGLAPAHPGAPPPLLAVVSEAPGTPRDAPDGAATAANGPISAPETALGVLDCDWTWGR